MEQDNICAPLIVNLGYLWWTKWRVFVDVYEENCFKIINLFSFHVCEDEKQCFITNIRQIFLFYAENTLKMRKMWTLKNKRLFVAFTRAVNSLKARETPKQEQICIKKHKNAKLQDTHNLAKG